MFCCCCLSVPPKFSPQPPSAKNIAEGEELSVACTATGMPTPNITWVWVLGQLTMRTGTGSATLRIRNIRRDQNGTYECQARNNHYEKQVIAQTVVTVYCKYMAAHETIIALSSTKLFGIAKLCSEINKI